MAKRTSSEEFLKGYNEIWKSGPSVKYNNPDSWLITKKDADQQHTQTSP